MRDKYGREISYLRISLTDKCNLRCRYCMPLTGIDDKPHSDIISEEEILSTVKVAVGLGIKKIRLTGGEPLVKKNIVSIVRNIKNINGVEELCITTNGTLLPNLAKDLKEAGLDRINISIDSLKPDKYEYITGGGKLEQALAGLEAACNTGFEKIKINSVLIGGFNDSEIEDFANITMDRDIDVRFIELMPMYDSGDFGPEAFVPYTIVIDKLKHRGIEQLDADGSVAKLYKIKGAKGKIGLISPVNDHFCANCNRIRLTADGKIKPCLHSSDEISIRGLNENDIKQKIEESIFKKPEKHEELSYISRSHANRNMNQIGG